MAEVLLHADGLGKTYGTVVRTVALSEVDFEMRPGEFASVIGQSGSGKSTLLNLIGLLDTPTAGRVVINGHDTAAASRKQRAAMRNDFIGFVFQFHYLLPEFSVIENVMMPGRIAGVHANDLKPRAGEVLALLGLQGLENKGANDLSGGQKQRVAIARALMNRPALVLADEPTGNLDTTNTKAVYQLFRTINETLGTAFLIVTHDRSVAQQTDRILEVSDGRLVQDVRNGYREPPPESEETPPEIEGSATMVLPPAEGELRPEEVAEDEAPAAEATGPAPRPPGHLDGPAAEPSGAVSAE